MDENKNKPGKSLKKVFKVVVRKLPIGNYDEKSFQENISKFSNQLGASLRFEHMLKGKLSRKRGPVTGTGFFTLVDEGSLKTVLSGRIPFLEGELGGQPEFLLAPYQKTFKKV
jgi:hypothetical protein